jgi:DNA repair exonuclease SbcCD nuclease subunit
VTEDLSAKYPQGDPELFNIGLLHTCLDGKPGHEPYAPCTIDGLRSKGYQYWALGHVHTREEVSHDPWIVFPGNIQGRHSRERGPKGCALVTVDENEVQTVEERTLDVLRWSICSIELTDTEKDDDVYERVLNAMQQTLDSAEGRPVAARVVLTGSCRMHSRLHAEFEHWRQECYAMATGLGGAGFWLEKLLLETRQPVRTEDLADREDALAGLLKAIRGLSLAEDVPVELLDELNVLRQKLPAELLTGEDRFEPTEPTQLKAALEDVREILTARLLAGGLD